LYGTFDVKAVLVSFFVRPMDRFFALTGDITLPRAGAVKAGRVGGHPKGRGLDSVEHGSILQAVGARSPRTIRGEPAVGRNQSRRKLVFGGSKRILTMMQSFASAARLRAVGPFSSSALKPFQMSGSPPPRIVINSPPCDR
jgi:hypothetical protein